MARQTIASPIPIRRFTIGTLVFSMRCTSLLRECGAFSAGAEPGSQSGAELSIAAAPSRVPRIIETAFDKGQIRMLQEAVPVVVGLQCENRNHPIHHLHTAEHVLPDNGREVTLQYLGMRTAELKRRFQHQLRKIFQTVRAMLGRGGQDCNR